MREQIDGAVPKARLTVTTLPYVYCEMVRVSLPILINLPAYAPNCAGAVVSSVTELLRKVGVAAKFVPPSHLISGGADDR